MKKYIIVDIGSSSVRTALIRQDLQIEQLEVYRRVITDVLDAEQEWNIVCSMLEKIMRKKPDPDGIAVSALLGWVGIDQAGRAVTPCFTYRCKFMQAYKKYSGKISEEEVCGITGRRVSAEWSAFLLLQLRDEEPDTYRKVNCLLSLKDFINGKLTGIFATDPTTAAYTMLYDVKKREWSGKLLEDLGLERQIFPEVKDAAAFLGNSSRRLAGGRTWSLQGVAPVAVGSVDGSVAILGAGGTRKADTVNVVGTTDVFFTVTECWPCDQSRKLVVNPHVIPDHYLIGGPMGMFAGTMAWFTRQLLRGGIPMEHLDKEAALLAPGCGGVYFYPSMTGERTPFWNSEFAGSVLGIRSDCGTEHLYRAIMEAECYTVKRTAELCTKAGGMAEKITVIGVGAENRLWLQIKADILGKEICTKEISEATMAGSAMLCMLMAGTEPAELPHPAVKEVFYPDSEKKHLYENIFREYLRGHDLLMHFYEK